MPITAVRRSCRPRLEALEDRIAPALVGHLPSPPAPPRLVIVSPVANATEAGNVTVSGTVTDQLGVALLQASVDGGARFKVAFAGGSFHFQTSLPLDGSGDGAHTVRLYAADTVGLTATAAVSFTLDTYLVNHAVTTDPGVQQMPSVAVDPANSEHVVIAYMDYSLVTTGYAGIGVAVSNDNGTTWTHTSVPLPAGFSQGAANPTVLFDGQGHLFISFMAATFLGPQAALTNGNFENRGAPGIESNNGIFVAQSDDGGMTWQQPVAVVSHLYDGKDPVFFECIPNLAIDTFQTLPNGQPNPRYDDLYVTWTRVYPPGEFPGQPSADGGTDSMVAVSTDGGQTWVTQLEDPSHVPSDLPESAATGPVTVIQDPLNIGPGNPVGLGTVDQNHLAIGPEGDLYLAYISGGDFTVAHSTDGGATWTIPSHALASQLPFGNGETIYVNEAGIPTNNFRTFPSREIVADPTRPGTVYVVSSEVITDAEGNQIDAADIVFARSSDYGATWQDTFQVGSNLNATVLNDDNGGNSATGLTPDEVISSQAIPSLAVNAKGDVSVIWYDTRHDPNNHLLDVWGTASTDGGLSFTANYRITSQSFDANAGVFTDATGQPDYYIGDAIGLALANNTAYAAWTDTRSGKQSIEFTRYLITPAPAAPTDRYQPNNTVAQATNLGTVNKLLTVARLAVPAAQSEWFGIQAAATGSLTVAAIQNDLGPGVRLQLYASNGRSLLATGANTLNSSGQITGQQIVYAGQSGVTYYVRVLNAGPGKSSEAYTLTLQSLTENLGTVAHVGSSGQLATGGQAYYFLKAAAAGAVQITETATAQALSALTLQLLDPNTLNVLAAGQVSGSTDIASTYVQQGQAILVRVANGGTLKAKYALDFTNLDQFAATSDSSLFFSVPGGPDQVAVGDLTGNGIPDLVVADSDSNTVSVLLGNGDGTFQAPRQYAVGSFQVPSVVGVAYNLPEFRRPIALADLTGNGILDIIVANYNSGDVSVLMGRGDGTFEPQRRYDATDAPIGLAVGDLTGNGIPDIVTISAHAGTDGEIAILLGRGDGTFLPEMTSPAGIGNGNPMSTVRLADLTGNGRLDLIVSGSNLNELTVFMANGDGTFQPGVNYVAGRLGAAVAVADVNGDGIPDIINTAADPSGLSVLLGNGDGTFTPLINPNTNLPLFPAGQTPLAIAVADFGSQITLADGSTALGPPDGHPDLIVAANGAPAISGAPGPPGIFIVPTLWDSQGEFEGLGNPYLLAPGVRLEDLTIADLTGNGVPDIIAVDENGVRVVFGPAGSSVTPADSNPAPRDLGTVVHLLEPTLTIVPGHEEDDYTLTVPTEAVQGAGNEVLDFSGGFQALEGAGITMQVLDAAGNILGSGARFRVSAPQGAVLTVRVFGLTDKQGNQGSGAYTLDIDVLPQVVSIQAEPLLPGATSAPGGPTASLVATLQGDRLDPTTAQNPANYTVTYLGPNANQVIPISSAVYDPSTNVDVTSGTTYPTAVKQTLTFLFNQALPAGSYQITVSSAVQTAAFNADEASELAPAAGFTGHPLVTLANGKITEGSKVQATNLVQAAGALGDFSVWEQGTPFFQQLHDDLGAILDAALTQGESDAQVTAALQNQITSRFDPALGAPGQRPTQLLVLWTDPVSEDLTDPTGASMDYNLGTGKLTNTIGDTFVSVVGNIEVIVVALPPPVSGQVMPDADGTYTLTVSDVPATARGGAVVLSQNGDTTQSLTTALQEGTTVFNLTV